ncbi:MAG: UDP-N-acetylmuramoyl-L-alanyl-D-glutamate--2,6-diaminopimelate ligase [Bryobacterales bacterium]|nr:UDP-N-acetylmuramoyl-L-alanyl-D-glutamate--2,6-diaminopimelate ligase [Bryobacterales bacterium]
MTVAEVLAGVPLRTPVPAAIEGQTVTGLGYDSRRVATGFLFFAFPGSRVDGRAFAAEAMRRGAVAVVSDLGPPEGFPGPWMETPHGRQALALAARNFYGAPDARIQLTGITGTNGKTTVAYLVDSVLRAAGKTTALVGTIEYRLAGKVLPAANTTPESLDLVALLAELEQLGGTHATMEVSSHALALGRVHALQFHTAVFTNLSQDHLDFHGTMEAYFHAKSRLFAGAGAPPPGWAVVNHEDPATPKLPIDPATRVIAYGLGQGASLRASHIASTVRGLQFHVGYGKQKKRIRSPLIGGVNVHNILAACGAGISYGLPLDTIAEGIAACPGIPGRFERVDEGQPFGVVVDYAHTPDALRNVIAIARALTRGRVITLFGCGGDRDRNKRPPMGQAAAASDFVVLTSDNPRSEDPIAILTDALVGVRRTDVAHAIEPDRAAAIRQAIGMAHAGDMVILAGKGHETYQEIAGQRNPFDDREVARMVLREMGFGGGQRT